MMQFQETASRDETLDRRMDGQTIFYRTLPVTIGCPKTQSKIKFININQKMYSSALILKKIQFFVLTF